MSQLTTEPATRTSAPALEALHHLGLTVSDIERSEAWYTQVLGLERMFVEDHHGGSGYAVVLNRPGTSLFIGLDHHDGNQGERFDERRTGLDHVAIAVASRDELDRWVEHLDAIGVAHSGVTDVDEPFPFAALVVRDPDNIQLELTWMS